MSYVLAVLRSERPGGTSSRRLPRPGLGIPAIVGGRFWVELRVRVPRFGHEDRLGKQRLGQPQHPTPIFDYANRGMHVLPITARRSTGLPGLQEICL